MAELFYTLLKCLARPFFGALFAIRCDGMERVPRSGPLIVICNHQSGFDPPVVAAILPRPVYFMTKAELFRFRPFAALIGALHAYPVKRGRPDRGAIRKSLDLLKAGETLLIFPEGHRTETGALQPARSGVVFLAKRAGAPIVPVGIVGRYGFRRRIRYYVGEPFVIPETMTTEAGQRLLMEQIATQMARGGVVHPTP